MLDYKYGFEDPLVYKVWAWFKYTKDSIKQYVRSKFKRKFTITSLDRNWLDKDEVLLHACFQILVNFFEDECPEEISVFEKEDYELKGLYLWWITERLNRKDAWDAKYFVGVEQPQNFNREEYKEYWDVLEVCSKREEEYRQEDTQNLIRLIELRNRMWT